MTKQQRTPDSALTQCTSAFGTVSLQRHSPDPTGSLRAWDAADIYLLDTIAAQHQPADDAQVLVINDDFGALSTQLCNHFGDKIKLQTVNDSFVGRRAARRNFSANGCTAEPDLKAFVSEAENTGDLILMKVPKSLALLHDQLHQIRDLAHRDSLIAAAGMARHLTANVRAAFDAILGPTSSSRAVRKARVLMPQLRQQPPPAANPYPGYLQVPELAQPLLQHAAVFSQKRLDWGSELLIKHLPEIATQAQVLDLGCGSGVLGLIAMQRQSSAHLTFVDESSAAIESVKANLKRLFPERQAVCLNQDCLDPLPDTAADLILCNPPFHTHRNLVSVTAERMFQQSLRALAPGGQLLIVGNRHLEYGKRLQRIFGNHRLLAENPRFQVISAKRR